MTYIIFILIKSFSECSCPADGDTVILEKTPPIRTEMFYHRINRIRICISHVTFHLIQVRGLPLQLRPSSPTSKPSAQKQNVPFLVMMQP